MKVGLSDFNISKSVFLEKVKKDLEVGVRVNTGIASDQDIVRVWTDTQNWQFSLLGLVGHNELTNVQKIEIQSFGESTRYIKLTVVKLELELNIDLQKLSPNFAELSEVNVDEAREFFDGYMTSTVNRTLTEQLFEEYAKDKNQFNWLEF